MRQRRAGIDVLTRWHPVSVTYQGVSFKLRTARVGHEWHMRRCATTLASVECERRWHELRSVAFAAYTALSRVYFRGTRPSVLSWKLGYGLLRTVSSR